MKKRFMGLLMAFTLANSMIMLTACGSAAQDTSEMDHLARVKASGKLIIAMEGQWAPWNWSDMTLK